MKAKISLISILLIFLAAQPALAACQASGPQQSGTEAVPSDQNSSSWQEAVPSDQKPSSRQEAAPSDQNPPSRQEPGVSSAARPAVMRPLEGEDPERAKPLAAACVVRLDIMGEDGEYYGSGVLWDSDEDGLIIVTAGHLLEKGELLRAAFPDGTTREGSILGISGRMDLGFVKLPWPENVETVRPGEEEGERPAEEVRPPEETEDADTSILSPPDPAASVPALASLHQRIFDTLDENSALFLIASTENGAADIRPDASLAEKSLLRAEFGTDVMLLTCEASPGMSGGGAFDGCGNLIGIVVGGTRTETAVLSMEKINQACEELGRKGRNTQDYQGNTDN